MHAVCVENKMDECLKEAFKVAMAKDAEKVRRYFVLLKGFCFGALHIGSLIDAGFNDMETKDEQLNLVVRRIAKAARCSQSSVKIYDALAEQHGLVAAAAAHVTGNIIQVVVAYFL